MSDEQGALFQRKLHEHRETWEATVRDVTMPDPLGLSELTAPTEPNDPSPAEAEGTDFIEEKGRREGAATAILRALKRGPCTSKELLKIGGIRFSARLFDLREAGWEIETERSGRQFVYRLVSR